MMPIYPIVRIQLSLVQFSIVTILGFYQKAEYTKPEFTCLKLTIKTLEQGLKYVQS